MNDRKWGGCRPAAFIFHLFSSNDRNWVGSSQSANGSRAYEADISNANAEYLVFQISKQWFHDVFEQRSINAGRIKDKHATHQHCHVNS
jgi:hypothetical protein